MSFNVFIQMKLNFHNMNFFLYIHILVVILLKLLDYVVYSINIIVPLVTQL
jgi:hypothetical protein